MKVPSVLTPYMEGIKLLVAVLLGCALLWGGQKVLGWREAAQQNEQRGRTMQATSGIVQDGTKADTQRADTDTGVAKGRSQFNDDYEEGVRYEPETAARAGDAVPASVRDAFRKRRLARERLGCAGGECRPRSEDEDAAER